MGSTWCAPVPIWLLFEWGLKRVYVLLKGNKIEHNGDHIKTEGTAHSEMEMLVIILEIFGSNSINVIECGRTMVKIQSLRVFENINYDFSYRQS
jgi:hypothetical protein